MPVLDVKMFGRLHVVLEGKEVINGVNKIKKHWRLFAYLVCNRGRNVDSDELYRAIWDGTQPADIINSIKNAVYMLRREFARISPNVSVILFENGFYNINPALTLHFDVDEFLRLCTTVVNAKMYGDELADKFDTLTRLYRGSFLAPINGEHWAMERAIYLRRQLSTALLSYCAMLYKEYMFTELLRVTTFYAMAEPNNETLYLYLMRALRGLCLHEQIINVYTSLSNVFYDATGTTPCDEMRKIYSEACAQNHNPELDLLIIREDLREAEGVSEISGAYFCSYASFKDMYHITRRSIQRDKRRITLILVSVTMHNRRASNNETLRTVMDRLHHACISALRVSDMYSKYSRSQYVVMLSTPDDEVVDGIVCRVREAARPICEEHKVNISFLPHIMG